MRVLVLGGAGYIGSIACQHLLENSNLEVTCVDSLRYNEPTALAHLLGQAGFGFVRADIRDIASYRYELTHADAVVNLAALVGEPVCKQFPIEAEEVNYGAVHTLCQELSLSQYLIQTSTNSGYGTTDGVSEVTEESPLNPISLYGKTKADAEKAVLDRSSSVSFRLATVFGVSPRMRFDLMVNDWTLRLQRIKADARGTLLRMFCIFEPHYRRNYVHVRDVARGIMHALNCGLTGAYNFGNPEADCSKWELAALICKRIGLDTACLAEDLSSRDPDQRNYKVSNKKILGSGFRFWRSLEEGIGEVARYAELLSDDQVALMRNVL